MEMKGEMVKKTINYFTPSPHHLSFQEQILIPVYTYVEINELWSIVREV